MALIRMVLLLVIVEGVAILVIQNFAPSLPLVIFGSTTISLPVSAWMLIFALGGLLTGSLVQLLRYSSGSQEKIWEEEPRKPQRNYVKREREEPLDELDEEEEWNIEEPPLRKDYTSGDSSSPVKEEKPKSPPSQSSETSNKSSSTDNSREVNKNGVYDANFRILKPPYGKGNEESDKDGESWEEF